ncbi:hypothetical protein [Paracoccus aerodenitrificans]|nr:hypothetical protein [Paracoccus aerodenitrificans]WBU63609.1 hypothetical protein PAE61_14840 [Paracoccus aerodenitrificans]
MSDPLTTPVFWAEGDDFAAAKLILTIDDAVLVYLRDDFDHIP